MYIPAIHSSDRPQRQPGLGPHHRGTCGQRSTSSTTSTRRRPLRTTSSRPAGADAGHSGDYQLGGQSAVVVHLLRPSIWPVGPRLTPPTTARFRGRFASWTRDRHPRPGSRQLGGDANLSQFALMSLVTTLHNFLYAYPAATSPTSATGWSRSSPPVSTPGCPARATAPAVDRLRAVRACRTASKDKPKKPRQGFLDNWNTKPSQQASTSITAVTLLGTTPLIAHQPAWSSPRR